MFTHNKVTEIFCIADDFCKEFSLEIKKHQLEGRIAERSYYRPSRMSESEIITILIYFHLEGYRNFRHFYLFYVCEHLQDEFLNAAAPSSFPLESDGVKLRRPAVGNYFYSCRRPVRSAETISMTVEYQDA